MMMMMIKMIMIMIMMTAAMVVGFRKNNFSFVCCGVFIILGGGDPS